MATRRTGSLIQTPFKVIGQKEVYLPNILITLHRTPRLPPQYAKFQVPLNLNKLDLKDYLYHAYGIEAQHIRSHVVQMPVRQNNPRDTRPAPRRWFRPKSQKFMTVQMDKPFVWPEEPEDYSPWDRDTYEAANKSQEAEQSKYLPDSSQKSPGDAESLKEQAKRLLSGEDKWRPGARDARMFSRVHVGTRGSKKGVSELQETRPQ